MLLRSINLQAFVLSFLVGVLVCYASSPPKRLVRRFPDPGNVDGVIYHTSVPGDCYKYVAFEVSCDADPAAPPLRKQPVNFGDTNSSVL